MYFSVITPHENRVREAGHQFASAYEQHQWVWRFFATESQQQRDFIFRRYDAQNLPRFYVVSQREPVPVSGAWQVQTRVYMPALQVGNHLRFELRANPTVAKKGSGEKSQRHDVVMSAKKSLLAEHDHQKWGQWNAEDKPRSYTLIDKTCTDWLTQRSEKNGFKLLNVQVDAYAQHRAGKRDIRFSSVDFSGELEVRDPALLQQALFQGIGHAKAFGCGLLLVKRV